MRIGPRPFEPNLDDGEHIDEPDLDDGEHIDEADLDDGEYIDEAVRAGTRRPRTR